MSSRCWTMHGPFSLDKASGDPWERHFRDRVSTHSGLADAAGVYIIASQYGARVRLRYIGMTHEQGFSKEVFSQRNRTLVWEPLSQEKNSQLLVWLVAKKTASGKGYSFRATMKNQAFTLETLFIMHAKAAGHQLINTSKWRSAEGIAVEGLFGKRKRGKKAKGLEQISGLLAL